MKHEKEWHTCDRCGEKIKAKPKNEMHFVRIGMYSDMTIDFSDSDIGAEIEKIHRVKFLNHKYELCPKCRKDFERFMRNE